MKSKAEQTPRAVTRRHFFRECGIGVGKMALASLLCSGRAGALPVSSDPLTVRPSHFPARAKHVIHMFMSGAPSQLDLFDYKPTLQKYDGKPVPEDLVKDQRYAFIQKDAALMASRFSFDKHGQSGAELSEMLPHLSTVADEIAFIRSVHTNQFNHAPAQVLMNTGASQLGRPCMGSWVTYGLGSEAEDLPGFVVLNSGGGASGGAHNWGCGFMPTVYQGVPFRSQGDPVLNVTNPKGITPEIQKETIDILGKLNRHLLDLNGDPEIATRINAYEMAYSMQTSAPELMDVSKESPETLALYGADPGKSSFANNCLLARRLIERGVRFINLYHGDWDHHSDVAGGLKVRCGETDKACAALITDLKQRGLLDETLIVWGGEFGRTPMVESSTTLGRSLGRDHHPQAFTMWMAGGGVKPGQTIGATDEFGFNITDRPVHVHDIQATILHLLGLEHTQLTFRFKGRDFRLTDVEGALINELIA